MRLQHVNLMLAGLIAGGLLSVPAAAGIIEQDLPGTTQYDGWSDISASNDQVSDLNNNEAPNDDFPGFSNFTDPWPEPIESHTSGSGDAVFNKVSGGGYPASSSIYNFSSTSTFEVSDSTPVDDLETVVFQTRIGEGTDGDFVSGNEPTLTYNGGTTAPNAPSSALITAESAEGFTGSLTVNTRLFQWDLRDVTTPITDFSIEWSTDQHATTSALRLDQSDTFGQASTAVPTPSAFALGLAGLGLTAVRRRRRRGVAL